MTSIDNVPGRRWLALAAALALAAGTWCGGCSGKYRQRGLTVDSQQGKAVSQMIEQLRQAGDGLAAVVDRQAVSDLTPQQHQGLQAALGEIASAQGAKLVSIDQFGEQVYRVSIELVTAAGQRTRVMLLVETGGELKWAGRN